MERIKDKIEAFKVLDLKTKLIIVIPYFFSMLFCSRIVELYRLCSGNFVKIIRNIEYLYKTMPHFALTDLLIGIPAGFFIVWYIKWENGLKRKNTRKGVEYGSARWGAEKDIKPFIDPNPFYNVILSKTERLSMSPKMKKFNLNRNKNVIVYGSSGSGKTFSFVKPNLMQMHSSYVITDPKGTLLPEMGNMFAKNGYRIKVLDTIDMGNSMKYNPFRYINEPKDILTLANTLQKNLKPPDAGPAQDPFFDQAALLWLQAVIGYLWYEAPPDEQNIPTLLEILEADEVKEDDENYKNAVDMLFEELEEKNPRHFAVKQRKKYKKAAGKTAKSILITLGASLSPFDIPDVSRLVSADELEVDTYGDKGQKTALFVIISDTDTTYNFIPAILFTQMFNVLCYKADKEYGGKLPVSVQFILDEFANIGTIPGFKTLITTIRSRMISAILILQTKSQLKDNYKEAAETIIGNCDTSVFLGGQEQSTLEEYEKSLGDETIDTYNDSKTYSTNESTGVNYQKLGRKLLNLNELKTLDRDKCIVNISGVAPFLSDKYPTAEHPNFKYTADYDEKNWFDFKKYRKDQKKSAAAKLKRSDVYKLYSVS
ncbi:MAG: type IV secretory system conjugative DNA transfer family protein [Lachnospiraceae bacterium]|nr:type IV secretory system conjugative DNA transfer family protein [Lachnospiraceae bacterium]